MKKKGVVALVLALALLAGCGPAAGLSSAPNSSAAAPASSVPPVGDAGKSATPAALLGPQILRNPAALREYGWYEWFAEMPEGPYVPVTSESLGVLWAQNEWGYQWTRPLDPDAVDFNTLLNSVCPSISWLKNFTTDDAELADMFSLDNAFPTFVLGFNRMGAGLGMDVLPMDTGVYYNGAWEGLGNGVFRFEMESNSNKPPDPANPVPMLTLEMKLEWPQEEHDFSTIIVTLLLAEGADAPVYAPYLNVPMKFISGEHAALNPGGGGDESGSGASSSVVPSSSGSSVSSGSEAVQLTNYERTRELPPGPYTPATRDELAADVGAWFHFLNPDDHELGGYSENAEPIIMVRFEQYEGSIQLAWGVYGTGGGPSHYIGTYTDMGEGVFSASIGEWASSPEEEDGPLFTVGLKAEWPQDSRETAVITLTEISPEADEGFVQIFQSYVGVPLVYIRG